MGRQFDVKTRFLIISDTHGDEYPELQPPEGIDVAIHCGDLTEESKLDELRKSIILLKRLPVPLKLVIPGNHDFTLDIPTFQQKVSEIQPPVPADLINTEYGSFGEARELFEEAKSAGVIFLDEGTHRFSLANGASMSIYASPYTPSLGGWDFQYSPRDNHEWAIPEDVDVVITHGPPNGVLDRTSSRIRAGNSGLFEAIARTRPRLHCFGHIHEGWGAKLVTWREHVSEAPSHLTDIDHGRSVVIETLPRLTASSFDPPEIAKEKLQRLSDHRKAGFCQTSHCVGDSRPAEPGTHTLFVNAAIQGPSPDEPFQLPWIVELELPRNQSA